MLRSKEALQKHEPTALVIDAIWLAEQAYYARVMAGLAQDANRDAKPSKIARKVAVRRRSTLGPGLRNGTTVFEMLYEP